jgi:hypothetical protein
MDASTQYPKIGGGSNETFTCNFTRCCVGWVGIAAGLCCARIASLPLVGKFQGQ